ncbi:pyridoxamine 5'-phosphate oxidase family protein [Candidatus Woesebacteria bacterium]|nr:pyridoxamine 5'-phosphate oxidase family protein [Candidatus Woesebacteria bacterium]
MSQKLEITKDIIQKISYLNIASITPEGMPWNSPVYTSFDADLNFFWVSWHKNQHSINIRNNPHVFTTIYDSTIPAGTGVGVYMEGKAYELSNLKETIHALKTHYGREKRKPRDVIEFMKKFPRRAYKFVPEKVWVNVDGEVKGNFVDKRVEVNILELKKRMSTEN